MDNLDLLLGKPLVLGNLTVRHPKISDVIELGESFVFSAINIFTLKPSDLMVELYDSGIDYRNTKPYDVFILLCGETLDRGDDGEIRWNRDSQVSKQLGWLTGIEDFMLSSDGENLFLTSPSTGAKIDIGVYTQIRKYFMDMNNRSEKETYNPGNDTTMKFLIEQERKKRKREEKRGHKSYLAPQISSLVWASGRSFEDVYNLYLYQFFDGLLRINKIKSYDNVCFGYYAGNIETSSFNKVKESLNWMT
ncbi:MAG: hypothetical protein PUH11_06920 [Bacilli bacterium]|nr:hypothetical protein [Bacilli bacterium]